MKTHQTLTINGTGKKALAEITVKDDEVTTNNITFFHDNGKIAYYDKKQCAKHQWLLYNAVKGAMYE